MAGRGAGYSVHAAVSGAKRERAELPGRGGLRAYAAAGGGAVAAAATGAGGDCVSRATGAEGGPRDAAEPRAKSRLRAGVGSSGTRLQRQRRQRQLLRGPGGVGADSGFIGDDAGGGRAGGVRLAGVVAFELVATALQVGHGADGAVLPALHGCKQSPARRGDGDELGAHSYGRGDADDSDRRRDADQRQFLL